MCPFCSFVQCETCEQKRNVQSLQLPSEVDVKEEKDDEGEKEKEEKGEMDEQKSGEMKEDDKEKSAISSVCTNFMKQVHVYMYVHAYVLIYVADRLPTRLGLTVLKLASHFYKTGQLNYYYM